MDADTKTMATFDPEFAQRLIDYDLTDYVRYFARAGIKSTVDLRRKLWQDDELMFGEEGYAQVTLLIVRAVMERYRIGHHIRFNIDDELYEVLRENKMLKYEFLLMAAGIRRVADIGQIWDKKKDFSLEVGSAAFGFWQLRYALENAYGFETRNNIYLRIGAHALQYVPDY